MTVPIPHIEHDYRHRKRYTRTWELTRNQLLEGFPLDMRRRAYEMYHYYGVEDAISTAPLLQWVSWVNSQRERLCA